MALVNQWKLENNGTDSCGLYNLTNSKVVTYRNDFKMEGNYCANFDGVSKQSLYNYSVNLYAYTNYSVSFWFKYINVGGTGYPQIFNTYTALNKRIYCQIDQSSSVWYIGFFDGTSYTSCTWEPLDNKWHHVVFNDANGTANAFMDGKVVGWTNIYAKWAEAFTKFTIGGYDKDNTTVSNYFVGQIDDFRIYNTTLTATEAAQLYAGYFTSRAAQAMSTI